MDHILNIPDALLDWGKDPAQAKRWLRPWAHEVQRLMAKTQMPCATCGTEDEDDPEHRHYCDGNGTVTLAPLSGADARCFWARLDALVSAAVREGRADLLCDLDLFSVAMLRLRVTLSDGLQTVSLGEGAEWGTQQTEALLEANAGPQQVQFVARAMALAREVFPQAPIGAIVSPDAARDRCASCDEADSVIMLQSTSGASYCRPCWEHLCTSGPRAEMRGGRVKLTWNEYA